MRWCLAFVLVLVLCFQPGCITYGLWAVTEPSGSPLSSSGSGLQGHLIARACLVPFTVVLDVGTAPLQLPIWLIALAGGLPLPG